MDKNSIMIFEQSFAYNLNIGIHNNCGMKKRIIKGANHKILQDQSQKLRDKLQLLKQQIEIKKRQKALSKNSNTLSNSTNQQIGKSRMSLSGKEQFKSLQSLLAEIKMEQLLAKLNQKNIISIKDFVSTPLSEIDKWRDVPVGYRIKIKKYLQTVQKQNQVAQSSLKKTEQMSAETSPVKNIEDIIKNRNQSKKYINLNRPTEYDEVIQDEQLNEDDQEVMIQSLIDAFQPAFQTFCESKQSQQTCQKGNHLQESKFSPLKYEVLPDVQDKEKIIGKEAWGDKNTFPDYKYCWSCLKMIPSIKNISFRNRQFCSDLCLSKYTKTTKIEEDNNFYEQIQKTQEQFGQFLQRREKQKDSKHNTNNINNGLQEIDFEIL